MLSDLLIDLETTKENRNQNTALKGYRKPKLIIIDEWLATTPTASEQQSLKALLNIRRGKGSIIFCSQFLKEGWYQQLGGTASTEAEAILDRIVHEIPMTTTSHTRIRQI